tara:strand:- start:428 stop:1396 length:969 start_codon:yes stop_codon:yes gene_type:complete
MATYESRRYNTPVTDVTKIADGSVNNTEFETLDGVTSDIQTQLNAKLSLSGGALTGALTTNSSISLGDSDSLTFGAGQDMTLFSNGTTGLIQANDLKLQSSTNENYITGLVNGAVELMYDNSNKLQTTATGINVTGTVDGSLFNGNGSNLTFLNASNLASGTVPVARLPAEAIGGGKVLQVVSSFNNTFYSSNSTSYTDITNMNVTITPTVSSSKILITFALGLVDDASGSNGGYSFRMLQGSTAIAQGTGGSVNQGTGYIGQETNNADTVMFQFLDSPGTTNALTYKLQFKNTYNGNIRINRSQDGQNSGASSITAMEIGA